MIGTKLVEEFVQSAALTHKVRGYDRVSVLLLASPESGKTTITTCATRGARVSHIMPVTVLSGKSVLKIVQDQKQLEFLLFNDLGSVRALSTPAVNLLIVILNQLVRGEKGIVGFAGELDTGVTRAVGIIGCLPFTSFTHHKSRWQELGFVSRMIPFAYSYPENLIVEIKNSVDRGTHHKQTTSTRKMKHVSSALINVTMSVPYTKIIRQLADEKADTLHQLGIRLLQNYHSLVRAHALLFNRHSVQRDDVIFLREVNKYVSINTCRALEPTYGVLD